MNAKILLFIVKTTWLSFSFIDSTKENNHLKFFLGKTRHANRSGSKNTRPEVHYGLDPA